MAKAKKPTSSISFREYLEESSDLYTSIILVIPLFVAYQLGVLLTGGVRNGVDFMSSLLWMAAGDDLITYLGINVGILGAFCVALYVMRDHGVFRPRLFPLVVAESTVYALIFGSAVVGMMGVFGLDVLLATGNAGEPGIISSVVLSFGAGLYEEIVFRLVLMGGMFYAATKWAKLPTAVAAIGAVIVSSLIFSGVHYIGSLGDAFTLGSFLFRFFAGVLLAAIFYVRGFAVAVYTHAIYDIIVMVFR